MSAVDVADPCRVRRGLGRRVERMRARHQLDGHVGDDVPRRTEIVRDVLEGLTAHRRQNPRGCSSTDNSPGEARLRGQRGLHRCSRRGPAWYSRPQLVGGNRHAADRRRGKRDGVRHLHRRQLEHPPAATVPPNAVETSRESHAACVPASALRRSAFDLVADDHRGEDVAPSTYCFAEREREPSTRSYRCEQCCAGSLSSRAAASLATALTRAAAPGGGSMPSNPLWRPGTPAEVQLANDARRGNLEPHRSARDCARETVFAARMLRSEYRRAWQPSRTLPIARQRFRSCSFCSSEIRRRGCGSPHSSCVSRAMGRRISHPT